jgi:LppP/LprE lipoprotein
LPPEPVTGRGWQTTPIGGDYKPCADLSTILVMIEGGTASSPVQALMFHRGTYLGTGTSKAYGFTSLNAARSTGETVVLDYATPGECDACAPASVTSVRYQWRGDHVEMLDPPPPS